MRVRLLNQPMVTIFLLAIFYSQAASATPQQLRILETANQFVKQDLERLVKEEKISRFELESGKLDPRLTLAACSSGKLEANWLSDPLKSTRNTVKVTCNNLWSVIVTANINVYRYVVVVSATLDRNTTITTENVELEEVPLRSTRYGYYLSTSEVVGQKALRFSSPGTVVTPRMLKPADLVEKGDNVVIVAKSDILSVKMLGTALSKGQQGEQILVRNSSSQRVVKAWVTAPGRVEIPF
ncbi:flagellar basal body P-ring biosynthesis protein FlgA [Oleiphilus messinensis]|uniref:Flagella basal body P-ring formation protein FlgA n=1 Tax=Oleiphilus messinensis TaxID=141451 RepID=A0A1Y0IB20_9GAMM|nr:flagellar basal body P-ring formation chaperone FlgA [Oleiphilus messinensis]ARU57450.1 flagellar basal body P-ring biosynthesis protein FlgA [Oleiphilus messinensis]